MKRKIGCLVILALFVGVMPYMVHAGEAPKLKEARFVCAYNTDYDTMLYAENEDKVVYPASTVKIMTAILSLEYYQGKMDSNITISQEVLDLAGGTLIGFKLDEVLTAEELLYGLIVGNGNDAAYALTLSIAPSVDEFVSLMNQKAEALGAKNTHYTNPTGVDDNGAYTTVADVARIAAYAAKMKSYTTISSCEKYTMGATNMSVERTIANKNYIVSNSYVSTYYLSYATGLNTGMTVKGGNCCVVSALKDGITNVAVVMNVGRTEALKTTAFADAKALIEWTYQQYRYEKVLTTADIVCEIPVTLSSSTDHVALLPGEDVYVYLPNDADVENDIVRTYELTEKSLRAPVEAGVEAGEMVLYYRDAEVGRVSLVTKNEVEGSIGLKMGAWFRAFFSNLWTLIFIALGVLIVITWILLTAYQRGSRKKR
ncbi:MAG: D-alanyl-D-alanine carboxypeptidase [Clostridiales bacterium]|nr:D-alanyl-D-alanine carboxypeptidase [Clostridiales bacterium]